MNRWFAILLSVLALGLVAGCGGDDDDDGGGGEAAETTEQPAEDTGGGGAAAGDTAEVGMKGIAFDPEEVSVKTGGTVKWTNNESIPHDVTKEDGPGADFSSGNGNMKQGDTYEQTFKEAGKVNYVCTVHPNMKGTVTVE
jgi:amicyanin